LATLDAVALTRGERGTDRALAADALQSLKELADEAASTSGVKGADDLIERLDAIDRVLASLPHDRARQLLRDARDAFRDSLYWRLKAAPALGLVVDAGSFTPRGELPRLRLRADDAATAAQANLRTAFKFIVKAAAELAKESRQSAVE
jgi:hypothetical protein